MKSNRPDQVLLKRREPAMPCQDWWVAKNQSLASLDFEKQKKIVWLDCAGEWVVRLLHPEIFSNRFHLSSKHDHHHHFCLWNPASTFKHLFSPTQCTFLMTSDIVLDSSTPHQQSYISFIIHLCELRSPNLTHFAYFHFSHSILPQMTAMPTWFNTIDPYWQFTPHVISIIWSLHPQFDSSSFSLVLNVHISPLWWTNWFSLWLCCSFYA